MRRAPGLTKSSVDRQVFDLEGILTRPTEGGRIDNACGASPATLHLFESCMKPRRNEVTQAQVDIVGKRFHKRWKIASMSR